MNKKEYQILREVMEALDEQALESVQDDRAIIYWGNNGYGKKVMDRAGESLREYEVQHPTDDPYVNIYYGEINAPQREGMTFRQAQLDIADSYKRRGELRRYRTSR